MDKMTFCDCSDESVFELASWNSEDREDGTDNLGMKSIVTCQSNKVGDLDEHGKELVSQCTTFLLFMEKYHKYKQPKNIGSKKSKRRKEFEILKKEINELMDKKYITIWSFIYDFLKIPADSGYDYWLMNFLDWNNIMDHGSGIRCGWINIDDTNIDIDTLDQQSENVIIEWIKTTKE